MVWAAIQSRPPYHRRQLMYQVFFLLTSNLCRNCQPLHFDCWPVDEPAGSLGCLGWAVSCLTSWLTGWVAVGSFVGCLTSWLTGWVAVGSFVCCLTSWFTGWVAVGSFVGCLTSWLTGWVAVGWFTWLCLFGGRLSGWLLAGSVGCVSWEVDCLASWLAVSWLVHLAVLAGR